MYSNRGSTSLKRKRRNECPILDYDRLPSELRAWIASEVQKESSVLQERRRAREERVLANPKKKGGKGGAGGEG